MVYVIILMFLCVILVLYMLFLAHHDNVQYQTIRDNRLPANFNGFRMFFISDIHRRKIRALTLQSITNHIDIVIIGGDLTEKGVPMERTRNNIRKLKSTHAPIYFIWGNNDYEANPEKLRAMLEQEGINILLNSSKDIKVGNQTISIMGLDCCTYGNTNLDGSVKGAKSLYKLLITHDPSAFMELAPDKQNMIHILLAGHTHGGQIRIFGKGPYERGKLSRIRETNVLISEGYGYTLLPFRLGTKAECHVLVLERN